MDEKAIQIFVAEVIGQKIIGNWLYWALMIAITFLTSISSSYLKKRGENLATKADFDELKRQLGETTKLTEQIKNEIGHSEWKSRERNTVVRQKLEEIVVEAQRFRIAAEPAIRDLVFGQDGEVVNIDTFSIMRFGALGRLYAPELAGEISQLEKAWTNYITFGFAVRMGELQHKTPGDAKNDMFQHFKAVDSAQERLEHAAALRMQELLSTPTKI